MTPKPPSTFAISVVLDEADIIEFCLRHASRYCEKIFVLDNGSTDGTWEIVCGLAEREGWVEPIERRPRPYSDGLKALAFEHARPDLEEGDWVLMLDSDEFLEVDPRPLLSHCNEEGYDYVRCLQAQFFVTDEDLDRDWFVSDERVDGFDRLPRHYVIDWSEVRLFRNSSSLRWPPWESEGVLSRRGYPHGLFSMAPVQPVNRHYQYRSRSQMTRRLESRSESYKETGWFSYNADPDWRSYIKDSGKLDRVEPGETIRASWRDRARVYLRKKRRELPRRVRRAIQRRLERWLPGRQMDESTP